jgi:uridine phosphorylase
VPIHLRPTAPIASCAVLPGDPGRALTLAQELLESPRMSNHHRGLWGYWGRTGGGLPLTVQSTGVGGPSAAIVLHELAELGVRWAVRVGTCRADSPGHPLGSLLIAGDALAADGASRALGAHDVVPASPALTEALAAAAPQAQVVRVATTDLYYDYGSPAANGGAGAEAVEMEAAPLFALGSRLGIEVGCLLAVAADPRGERISDESLREAELRMGRAAATALSAVAGQPAQDPR